MDRSTGNCALTGHHTPAASTSYVPRGSRSSRLGASGPSRISRSVEGRMSSAARCMEPGLPTQSHRSSKDCLGNSAQFDHRPHGSQISAPSRHAQRPYSSRFQDSASLLHRPMSSRLVSNTGSSHPASWDFLNLGATTPSAGCGMSGLSFMGPYFGNLQWSWDSKPPPKMGSKQDQGPTTPQKPLTETPEKLQELGNDDTTPPKDHNPNLPHRRSTHNMPVSQQPKGKENKPLDSRITIEHKPPIGYVKPTPREHNIMQSINQIMANSGNAEIASITSQEELPEFAVTSNRYSRESALFSMENLPHSLRNALLFVKNIPVMPFTSLTSHIPLLPLARRSAWRRTLVLDLDETLAHCKRNANSRIRPIAPSPEHLIVQFDDQPSFGVVGFRPFVQEFLEVASKEFEIVIFTASQKSYADKVIDALDPDGTLIEHRLYREHCTEMRGAFFKELRLLGRPLHQCIIVDNSPISVACNLDNGILIRSWYDDPNDQELPALLELLQEMSFSGVDCGEYLSRRYGLRSFFQGLREGVGHSLP